jgi:hypothetical protein
MLNNQTSTIHAIFKETSKDVFNIDAQSACKIIINFLEYIGMRGFITVLGIRTTPGSCDSLPQSREELYKSYNIPFTKKSGGDKKDKRDDIDEKYNSKTTRITVGARALSKHSDRTSDKV